MINKLIRKLMFVMICGFQVAAFANSNDVRDYIEVFLSNAPQNTARQINGIAIASQTILPAIYQDREFNPLWRNELSILQYMDILKGIDEEGLDVSDYHFHELKSIRDRLWQLQKDRPDLRAEYDILLTDSLLRLGYHLVAGKVDPVQLDSHWNMALNVGKLNMMFEMTDAIQRGRIDILIDYLRPNFPIYTRLKSALKEYRLISRNGGWGKIPTGRTLKIGDSDSRIPFIRQRLAITHDYQGEITDEIRYDNDLGEAVRNFQYRHNLPPNAYITDKTIGRMNVPVENKIEKIRINMERARWVMHDLPEKFIMADIAGYSVTYYDNGKSIWRTRAQVGKTFRKTPILRSEITYLVINPTWTVPPTILKEDILPKINKDPEYLIRKDLRVIDYEGNAIDAETIDWSQYPENSFPYLIRQNPGPGGALGRVKFMFPNDYSVYIHDTPYRSLFSKSERAFSSGCIRIERPYELIEMLLNDPVNWNSERITETIDSLQTVNVSLPEPITVLLFYWTATVDDEGHILFRPDIYQRDAAVSRGLSNGFQFTPTKIERIMEEIELSQRNKRYKTSLLDRFPLHETD